MHRALETSLGSLRSLFGILMGLTFANGIRNFITKAPSDPVSGGDVWAPPLALATLFFFMVIQFFHYNHRLLDEVISPGAPRDQVADPTRRSRYANLWFEYLFLLTQAALFGAASFYIYQAAEFIVLMTIILGLNLLLFTRRVWWFAIELWPRLGMLADSIGPFQRGPEVRDYAFRGASRTTLRSMDWFRERYRWGRDTKWFIINAAAVIVLISILAIPGGGLDEFGWRFWLAVSVLSVRVGVDYAINWSHYFPEGPTAMKVYLSAPTRGFQTSEQTEFEPGYRAGVRSDPTFNIAPDSA